MRSRGARGARTAAVAVALALFAHLAVGGRVSWGLITLVSVGAIGLAGFAVLRRPGLVTSIVGLAGLQAAVHVLAATSATTNAGGSGFTFLCAAHGGSGGVTASHLVTMIASHAVATLLSVWWLLHGDRISVQLAVDVRTALASLFAPPTAPIPARQLAMTEAARDRCIARSSRIAGRAPPLSSWS